MHIFWVEASEEEVLEVYLSATAQTAEDSEFCLLDLLDQLFMHVVSILNETGKGGQFEQTTGRVGRNTDLALGELTSQCLRFANFVDAEGSDRKFSSTLQMGKVDLIGLHVLSDQVSYFV